MYTPHTQARYRADARCRRRRSLEELLRVPDALALRATLDIVPALPEYSIARRFDDIAKKNTGAGYRSFLGGGAYRHYVPPAIGALAMRGEFLTAYTPYQAEVSQGYLQAIYEWQTYICLLTGMDIANASVYDGATALAEGAIMALNATGRRKLLVSRAVHPNYRAVLKTYCDGLDVEIDEIPLHDRRRDRCGGRARGRRRQRLRSGGAAVARTFSATSTCCPATSATRLYDGETIAIAVVAEALALAALATPASLGAQIVVGEAQSFGVAVAYGGPYAGFIATTQEHLRRIPGPARRQERRQRGPHRLRADAAGARTAYSPRTRHFEHLHQSSALRADRDDLSRAHGKDGPARRRGDQYGALARTRDRGVVASTASICKFAAPFFNEFVVDVHQNAAGVLWRRSKRAAFSAASISAASIPNSSTCMLDDGDRVDDDRRYRRAGIRSDGGEPCPRRRLIAPRRRRSSTSARKGARTGISSTASRSTSFCPHRSCATTFRFRTTASST